MSLNPLICFHPSGKYLYSCDYERLYEEAFSLIDSPQLKIFQIDYEWGQKPSSFSKALYPSRQVQVFLPKSYELLNEKELHERTKDSFFHRESSFVPLVKEKQYENDLTLILKKISLGHFYQLNYTFPFKAHFTGTPLGIFHHYHEKILGAFHALLPGDEYHIISCSPELFLKKEGTKLLTRPIKGTSRSSEELLKSLKEEAELSMIVDLLRNDLNQIADKREARVLKHRELIDLGNLYHTYSEIEAHSTKKLTEILHQMLPGGSISGCPKKEACDVLSQTEAYKRQAYTGVIGIAQNDWALINIAIRTFIANNKQELFYHAGGGIVYDSKIKDEYDELLLKASKI